MKITLLLFLIALPFILYAVKNPTYVERKLILEEKLLIIFYFALIIYLIFNV